jgi:bacteriorhodopsin
MVSELTSVEYSLVYNTLSGVVAAMFATFFFLFQAKELVLPKLRLALIVAGIVVLVAGYHYFQIFNNWVAAFAFDNGSYVATGLPLNHAYRYVDWLTTVPLLLIELVLVTEMAEKASKPLLISLSIAALLMIGIGYPGELTTDETMRWVYFGGSMLPFLFILFTLFTKFTGEAKDSSPKVRRLIGMAMILLIVTWLFYPVAYLFNVSAIGATGLIGIQFGYSIADVLAKCIFGVYIFRIAKAKTDYALAQANQ